MALLPTSLSLTDSTTTNAQQKTNFTAIRTFLADLLGTDSSNKVSARTALDCGQGVYGSRGLTGKVNATTPLIKYDVSADAVVLRNATGGTTTQYSVAATTCDLGLAGPAANGRDQSGAFSANTWVYVYFIYNGTTMATLASLSAPPTAPSLPAGYTHWCLATALRWNASSNIAPMLTRGSMTWYDSAAGTSVLVSGAATSLTSVSCSTFVPPTAVDAQFSFSLSVNSSALASFQAYARPTGASNAATPLVAASVQVANTTSTGVSSVSMPLGNSTQIDYNLNNAPTTGGLTISVLGFTLPSGAM